MRNSGSRAVAPLPLVDSSTLAITSPIAAPIWS